MMAEENKLAGLGLKTAGTQPQPDGKPDASVTDKEVKALGGEAGPGVVPAFGKHGGGEDENNPLTEVSELESLKTGAAQNSNSTDSDFQDALAGQGLNPDAPEDGSVEYVSPNIPNLRVAGRQFDNGRLSLKAEDAEKFEQALQSAHPRTQAAVRKVDRAAGEAVARSFLGRTSRGIDTSDNGPGRGDKSPAAPQ
jgi:hypothetical protein